MYYSRIPLQLRRVAELPVSAWIYHSTRSGTVVLAGSGVEEFPSGIFEGCWSGEFSQGAFAGAENVFGSGISFVTEVPRFVAPKTVHSDLFIWLTSDSETVSNSLPFLLEFCGIDLPYRNWGGRFTAAGGGIDSDYRSLYKSDEGELLRNMYDDFEIRNGRIETFRPAPGPTFDNFAAYYHYLHEQLGLAIANGRDPARRRPLRAIATSSSGYDSVAAMAIAAKFGLEAVLTLSRSRTGDDDSGRPAAEDLGLPVIERDFRPGSASLEDEVAFIATGSGGEDLYFSAFTEQLRDAMVITGNYGDKVWGSKKPPATDLTKRDRSGSTMGEFFIKVGATHIPVPMIGARRHPDIQRISMSAEMAPWRIGGDYDRPVPRRIAEEAGVRRENFGKKKRAASQLVFSSPFFLSHASKQDFREKERIILGSDVRRYRVDRIKHRVQRKLLDVSRAILRRLGASKSFMKSADDFVVRDFQRFEHSNPQFSNALFLWAIDHQRQVYQNGLRESVCRD